MNESNESSTYDEKSAVSQKIHLNRDQKRFIKCFPELSQEVTSLGPVYTCNLERDVLWQGKIYITSSHICFYGKIFAKAAKVTIHFKDIIQIEKRSTVGMFPNAIRINTPNIEYVFSSFLKRDATYSYFCESWQHIKPDIILENNNAILRSQVEKNNNEYIAGSENNQDSSLYNDLTYIQNNKPPSQIESTDQNQNQNQNGINSTLKKSFSLEDQYQLSDVNNLKNSEISRTNLYSHSLPNSSMALEKSEITQKKNALTHIELSLDSDPNLSLQSYIPFSNTSNDDNELNKASTIDTYQYKIIDTVFITDPKTLFQYIFDEINNKFLFDVYKNSNNENIKIGPWKKDARTNLKERNVLFTSLNRAFFSTRGNVLYDEKQSIINCEKNYYTIESEVKIINITYCDYFKIYYKYFIIQKDENSTRLSISLEIHFTKKLALSDKIEKTIIENYTKIFEELEIQLNKEFKKYEKEKTTTNTIDTSTIDNTNVEKNSNNNNEIKENEELIEKSKETKINNKESENNEIDTKKKNEKVNKIENILKMEEKRMGQRRRRRNQINKRIMSSQYFNLLLDVVFFITNIIISSPKFIMKLFSSFISKNNSKTKSNTAKKSGNDNNNDDENDKSALQSSPYFLVIMVFVLILGIIITMMNIRFVHQVNNNIENILKKKHESMMNMDFIYNDKNKMNENDNKNEKNYKPESEIKKIIYESAYSRYQNIQNQFEKQREKQIKDFELSYLRLNQQTEYLNKKIENLKTDLDSILKNISEDKLIEVIKELEKNSEEKEKE